MGLYILAKWQQHELTHSVKELHEMRKIGVGLIFNILSIVIAVGLNFVLAPYIVSKLGSTAYGFDTLSDNVSSYATIITTALNYMGCRFIAYAYHQGKKDEANSFYSSLFFGDLFLAIIMGLILLVIVIFLENIINIPVELVSDVKVTFLLTFMCFLLRVIETAFTAGAYVAQRMDLYAVRQILYQIIRAVAILVLYMFFEPKIYYISLATWIATIANVMMDYSLTRKLLPDLKIRITYFARSCIKSLISSGVWYSIVSLGSVIANGLDLLITNQYIGSYYMGILAVSKVVTTAISRIRSAILNVFNPNLMKSYAKGNMDVIVNQVKNTMRITSFILNVPLAGIAVFGKVFYKNWLPDYSSNEVQLVTTLTILGMISIVINVNMGSIGEICALVNKLKLATCVNLAENALSLVLTLLFLCKTELGVFAVAGVSSVVSSVYFLVFVIPYMAVLLKQKKLFFFSTLFRGIADFGILTILYSVIVSKVQFSDWSDFVFWVLISGLIGYLISGVICLKKEDRKMFLKWRK